MSLHAWSSARFLLPLPPGHRFPIEKYERLRQRVLDDGLVALSHLHEPARVADALLRLVHTDDYIERLSSGRLTEAEVRRIGFPWSPDLVERSYRAVGGTCEAVARALATSGVAINLAGGTHHAFATHGEGFCVFNDVAVAVRHALTEGRIARAAIIDLDVAAVRERSRQNALRASAPAATKPSPERAFAIRTTSDAARPTAPSSSPTTSPISTIFGSAARRDLVV